ncbi:YqhA family protein [Methyloprofundus sp.]|uniref:YqhA family protein n=1 Tax=Methyloprofundus sp. TaxID=2020875 RepID=UPI003D0BF4BC
MQKIDSLVSKVLLLRYISLIAIVFSFVGSGFMFFMGASKTIKAINVYLTGQIETGVHQHLSSSSLAIINLIESLDAFLFALVLLIFSYGIFQIFILRRPIGSSEHQLEWLNIHNISQLKMMLIEVIIVILFVFFLKYTLLHFAEASWEMLVLPISILLLSISLYILKKEL